MSQWILQNKVSGTFYAREVSPSYNQEQPLANVAMFDKNVITIETDDDINNISRGCIVLYQGHPWMVETVQQKLHRKESQFDIEEHYKTIISMRR